MKFTTLIVHFENKHHGCTYSGCVLTGNLVSSGFFNFFKTSMCKYDHCLASIINSCPSIRREQLVKWVFFTQMHFYCQSNMDLHNQNHTASIEGSFYLRVENEYLMKLLWHLNVLRGSQYRRISLLTASRRGWRPSMASCHVCCSMSSMSPRPPPPSPSAPQLPRGPSSQPGRGAGAGTHTGMRKPRQGIRIPDFVQARVQVPVQSPSPKSIREHHQRRSRW